ncbi:hypothetical protein BGZ91_003203, partial [Linnemannia elongata]
MEHDNVQDLHVDRLIIRNRLDYSDASGPRPTVHVNDTYLDPLMPHQVVASGVAIDTEPTTLQENVMETKPDSSKEQKSNTVNDITDVTSTTKQDQASGLNYASEDNGASLGDKDAQVALGDMYKDGLGVQQDYKAAME